MFYVKCKELKLLLNGFKKKIIIYHSEEYFPLGEYITINYTPTYLFCSDKGCYTYLTAEYVKNITVNLFIYKEDQKDFKIDKEIVILYSYIHPIEKKMCKQIKIPISDLCNIEEINQGSYYFTLKQVNKKKPIVSN